MQALFFRARRLAPQREPLAEAHYREARIEAACDVLWAQGVASEKGPPLRPRYWKHRGELLVFWYRADVPPDNQASERALRNAVIHRQVRGDFGRNGGGGRCDRGDGERDGEEARPARGGCLANASGPIRDGGGGRRWTR